MLIIKGGISRRVDEAELHVYLNRGYRPIKEVAEEAPKPVIVEQKPTEEPGAIEELDEVAEVAEEAPKRKPLARMTTAELELEAMELDIDISECKNNAERVATIENKIKELGEGGV